MRIINRYVLREFLRVMLLSLLIFALVFYMVDFLEKIDNFLEAGVGLSRVFYYFALLAPAVVFYLAPVAVLVGTLISLGLLARHSEIVAMKAGGISMFRLAAPLLLTSALTGMVMFILADRVIPITSAAVNHIWNVEVEGQGRVKPYIRRNVWIRNYKNVFHFRKYNQKEGTLQGISAYYFSDTFRLVRRVEAASARWADDHWVFGDGLVKTFGPGGNITVRRFEQEVFPLPALEKDFGREEKSAEELSTSELRDWIHRMDAEGYDPLRYMVDLHMRYSFPFICLIMTAIGLPIALWKEKGGGIALGIGVGIGISFIYLVFLGLSRSLGYSGLLPPPVAAWLPNVIFSLLGMYLFTYVRQ